ncbi:MAG: tyrosine-type recombinase/integrase [Opitutaceae bacterium]
MKSLPNALAEYLELRREFGYKPDRIETRLRRFLSFWDEKGTSRITTALALQFATEPAPRAQATKTGYLCAVRGFVRYLAGIDSTVEVPPPGLLRPSLSRFRPCIYSDAEIRRLLTAALRIPSAKWCGGRYRLKPWTLHGLLGLLAVTGLRVSEVTGLESEDIDWSEGVLRIKNTKFLKSRLGPLHPSTREPLRSDAKRRDRFLAERAHGSCAPFFVTCSGKPCRRGHVGHDFRKLPGQIGLRTPGASHGPRIHDLRHRFAVTTLLRWYRSGKPVERLRPVLSTYLGHSHGTGTYWSLSCTPELMAAAGKRLEARWKGARHADQR